MDENDDQLSKNGGFLALSQDLSRIYLHDLINLYMIDSKSSVSFWQSFEKSNHLPNGLVELKLLSDFGTPNKSLHEIYLTLSGKLP